MDTNAASSAMARLAIKTLIDDWGLWRDTRRWDHLRAAYAPGATMVTTWFDGLASDFVDASIRGSTAPTLATHFFGPSTIDVRGARAVAESRLVLMLRATLDGVEIDITCHGRFVDRLVETPDGWRILSRVPIYEKDSMATTRPGPAVALDVERLMTYPIGFRHLAYVQASSGATITTTIPEHNSDAQRDLYAATQAWLDAKA